MVSASGETEKSIRELSVAVVESVNLLNLLKNSMDSMVKWRSEEEKQSAETNKTMTAMNMMIESLVELMNKQLPMEDDQQTP